jgi:c-di-GMP-related signal transduction protein
MGKTGMAPAKPDQHRFLGRQSILDQKMDLYGYEILFRAGRVNEFSGDIEDATNQTIDCCLSMVACSSSKKFFINCTRKALVSLNVKLLPYRTVVLEILENVTADAELVRACKELKRSGFRFALDDFSPHDYKAELVELADYVKVDFRASSPDARREIYEIFRNKKVTFLAEKVETLAEVRTAQAEGNTLFQGYFHSRPEIIAESQISPIQSVYLQLFATLAKSPMDDRKVERLLLMEPSLCFRLLRVANSAANAFRHRISTIQEALHAVGEDAFRKLVTLVVASKLAHSVVDRDSQQAVERACFCESLASLLHENPAELYMVGMLSMMDRMLNIPMKQLLELISVDSHIQEALLGSAKGLGRALELCRYHEHGGDTQGLTHPDAFVQDSTPYYFEALLKAGSALHQA